MILGYYKTILDRCLLGIDLLKEGTTMQTQYLKLSDGTIAFDDQGQGLCLGPKISFAHQPDQSSHLCAAVGRGAVWLLLPENVPDSTSSRFFGASAQSEGNAKGTWSPASDTAPVLREQWSHIYLPFP